MKNKFAAGGTAGEGLFRLGTHLGRHQAYGLVANRCTAAEAECLRNIRQSGEYQRLGLNWEQFCARQAGISRAYADGVIRRLEEFGANYFRLAEVMALSPATYRLIAGSVTDAGLETGGEVIPIQPENRDKIAAAVESARRSAKPALETAARTPKLGDLRQLFRDFLDAAAALSADAQQRPELILLLEEAGKRIGTLVEEARRKTRGVE